MAEAVPIHGTTSTAKVRHPLAVFGLIFLTLGIYYLVWYYKINREFARSGRATDDATRLGRSPFPVADGDQHRLAPPRPAVRLVYQTLQRIETAQEISGTGRR